MSGKSPPNLENPHSCTPCALSPHPQSAWCAHPISKRSSPSSPHSLFSPPIWSPHFCCTATTTSITHLHPISPNNPPLPPRTTNSSPRHGRKFVRGDLLRPGTPQPLGVLGEAPDAPESSLWIRGTVALGPPPLRADGGAVGNVASTSWILGGNRHRNGSMSLLPGNGNENGGGVGGSDGDRGNDEDSRVFTAEEVRHLSSTHHTNTFSLICSLGSFGRSIRFALVCSLCLSPNTDSLHSHSPSLLRTLARSLRRLRASRTSRHRPRPMHAVPETAARPARCPAKVLARVAVPRRGAQEPAGKQWDAEPELRRIWEREQDPVWEAVGRRRPSKAPWRP